MITKIYDFKNHPANYNGDDTAILCITHEDKFFYLHARELLDVESIKRYYDDCEGSPCVVGSIVEECIDGGNMNYLFWSENMEPKEKKRENLCVCELNIIMINGCQCGGT